MAPHLELPLLPVLQKVPPPTMAQRQAPGFDMRTLRKQLDALYSEAEERYRQQTVLYDQNQTLFQYLQQLLKANQVAWSRCGFCLLIIFNVVVVISHWTQLLCSQIARRRNSRQIYCMLN